MSDLNDMEKQRLKVKIENVLKQLRKRKIEKKIDGSHVNLAYKEALKYAINLIEKELSRDLDLDLEKIEEYERNFQIRYYLDQREGER